jgi:uncharacterized membrane protein YdbT with pleckstrin-like domain
MNESSNSSKKQLESKLCMHEVELTEEIIDKSDKSMQRRMQFQELMVQDYSGDEILKYSLFLP